MRLSVQGLRCSSLAKRQRSLSPVGCYGPAVTRFVAGPLTRVVLVVTSEAPGTTVVPSPTGSAGEGLEGGPVEGGQREVTVGLSEPPHGLGVGAASRCRHGSGEERLCCLGHRHDVSYG